MRTKNTGVSICLISTLLFLCLACLEIPEMSRLNDDVSNDFTILTTPSHATSTDAKIRSVEAKRENADALSRLHSVTFATGARPERPEHRDLLALHSFWRT
jgi:hypothetical protein